MFDGREGREETILSEDCARGRGDKDDLRFLLIGDWDFGRLSEEREDDFIFLV